MGGWGSGRQGGRPTADASRRIDLAWMLREGMAREGEYYAGTLSWTCGGEPSGRIGYRADMRSPGHEVLELNYTRGEGETREEVQQFVRLIFTVPHFGGKRWWMVCPYRGHRVGKLYMPPWGDRFASRAAWRLGYQSQRGAARDRPFQRLFRLQRKLGCEPGWEAGLQRPKGMWHRTYERYLERYWELDAECSLAMSSLLQRYEGLRG